MHEQVIVGEAVAGESVQLKTALHAAIATYNKSVFDIIELLHKVRDKCYYLPDFNTMTEFCQAMGLKERKTDYLLRIGKIMAESGIPRATYEPLGIMRLREICRLNPNDVYENPMTHEKSSIKDWIVSLVTGGATIPLESIQQSVRVLLGEVGENSKTWLNLPYTRLTMEKTIRPGIEKAKLIIGTTAKKEDGTAIEATDASAVEMIVADFLGEPELEAE